MNQITYRLILEADINVLEMYYEDLLRVYSDFGYRLPIPDHAGALWIASFNRTLGRFSQVFIAESNSEIVGFALARLKRLPPYQGGELVAELSDIYLVEKVRHQGIATQLCKMVIGWANENNACSVEAQVLVSNEASRRMFLTLGLTPSYPRYAWSWLVPIKLLTSQLFTSKLDQIGINSGDGLLIHSALQFLGQPDGGIEMIFHSLKNLITVSGTIAVPTFNFDFANGEEFKIKETPSKGMGVFSEYIRLHLNSLRTHHPLQSIAINGFHALDIAERDTLSAFDAGSAFERMLDLDFKCLLLGANVNSCSIIHYSEQRANVPYRYWKNFSGFVDGKYATYRMFVRDLELNPLLDLTPIKSRLIEQRLWNEVQINYGILASFKIKDFYNSANEFLSKDPFCLLSNRESVIEKLTKHQKD